MLCFCLYKPSLTPVAWDAWTHMSILEMWESLWPMWQNLTNGDVSWQTNVPLFHPSSGRFGDIVHSKRLLRRSHRSSSQFYPVTASPILYLCIGYPSFCIHSYSSWLSLLFLWLYSLMNYSCIRLSLRLCFWNFLGWEITLKKNILKNSFD